MTTNLPHSLTLLLPTILHLKVAEAYAAAVDAAVLLHVAELKENILRDTVAYLEGYGVTKLSPQAEPAQDEPQAEPAPNELAALSNNRNIGAGERGFYQDKYVATFRARFSNGERELRDIVQCLPNGSMINGAQMDAIKAHFGMVNRSQLLAPMLREIGCREAPRGTWTTPILRIEHTI